MYTRILVFCCVLKNVNTISKIKRFEVTDYAALRSGPINTIPNKKEIHHVELT